MKGNFRGLHARAFSHATEDVEKVKAAMTNLLGPHELTVSRTEGVHGNPLVIIEANIEGSDGVLQLFSKLGTGDIETILNTIEQRTDEGCNLFMKIDKQSAFQGTIKLDRGDDVISVRIRVAAFPAAEEVARALVRETLEHELAARAR